MTSLKPYTIVEFVTRGKKRKQRSVDVVPSKWIVFNKTRNKGTTRFLSTIEDEDDGQFLHDIVKNLGDPPECWTIYSVIILGDAESYDIALDKMKRLEDEQHVFSLESSEELEERQSKVLEQIKRQKLLKEEAQLIESLKPEPVVSEIESDEAEDLNSAESPRNNMNSSGSIDADLSDNDGSSNLGNARKVVERDMTVQAKHKTYMKNHNSNGSTNKPSLSAQVNMCSSKNNDASVNNRPPPFVNMELPVVDIPHVTSTSDFITAVLGHLAMIYAEQKIINQRLDNIDKFLCDKEVKMSKASNVVDFESKYDFKLPIEDKANFIKFNEQLQQNKYMKKDLITTLKTCVDTENSVITKSMLAMLRKFISKAVAIQYTATRKSPTDKKDIFKTCEFCTVMEYVILTTRKEKNMETNDKLLNKGLSDVLSNAIHWDVKRTKK